MKLPWISRGSHDAVVTLLSTQVRELKDERTLLLDRLATLGLGGPIFKISEAVEEETAEAPELADPEAEILDKLMRFRRRPARLADALTLKAYREYSKRGARPKVSWIPQVDRMNAELDSAEAQGKRLNGN